MPELLSLAWKSKSSDVRDKFYAMLGPYSLKPGGIQIQPDYSISLQHLATGFFAHCIINEGASHLLLKASGANAEAGIPSWMPNWKDPVAWEKLLGNEDEENPSWDGVKNMMPEFHHDNVVQIRFVPNPTAENNAPKNISKRLWYHGATVDADSGAMTLNLTRLSTIDRFMRARESQDFSWYRFRCTSHGGYISLASPRKLDALVEVEDEVYLFDNNITAPIYLVLRPTGGQHEFLLVAACPHLVCTFRDYPLETPLSHRQDQKVDAIPITDLQQSLYSDLIKLHNSLDQTVEFEFSTKPAADRKRRGDTPNSPTYCTHEIDLPVQVGGGPISPSYDVWGLGCVYLELVTWWLGAWEHVEKFASRRLMPDLFHWPNSRLLRSSDKFFTIQWSSHTRGWEARVKDVISQVSISQTMRVYL
ncbi:HET domain-containing protein [Fusarium falciforme]|uniref:HET domain-containing protein n=1 Tax=Fusarium falciforme TaxID=195108 RepID=UPI00230119BA|nr:HET domain-containing protein [Fusarium falciforme]WAO92054.1 HET domain-containing protein [Fusarium falciforme]